ncbi:MAG TPA: ATP-binding protein [Euzebyales bacterium]|nr:ATP-binding protein [Euzebyales bacterium]
MTPVDLTAFELWHVTAVPRHATDRVGGTEPDPSKVTTDASVQMALVAAYANLVRHTPAPGEPPPGIVAIWLRDAANQLRFLCGGRPDFPPALPSAATSGAGEARVLYPIGARGRRADLAAIRQRLSELPSWVGIEGQHAPQVDELPAPELRTASRLEDCIAHLPGTECAVVVLAEPVAADEIEHRLRVVEQHLSAVRAQASLESRRVQARRAEARYEELSHGRTTGLWAIRMFVGATTATAATSLAAMACNTADVTATSYRLRPSWAAGSPSGTPLPARMATDDWMIPIIGNVDLLAAIARPPQRELPGIRLEARHCFDVTPEQVGTFDGRDAGGPCLALGSVLDESLSPAGNFPVPLDTLNRHAFVCGATGSGKSQTVRALLERATGAGIAWLAIEPAKAEYARMAGRVNGLGPHADVYVIRPGDPDHAPASLNPLEPEPGFPLQSHLDLVRALFLAAFDADEPFPQVLAHALTKVYDRAGWDLAIGSPARDPQTDGGEQRAPRYPVLSDLQDVAHQVISEIGYGQEVTDNVRGFIDVRLSSLRLGASGRFFEGGHPVDIGELLRRNTVLEIEQIANDQDKAFLIGAVIIRIVEHLRVRYGRREEPVGLHHLTVIEEAHRLLRNAPEGPRAQAVEIFASLLAEIRAYGEGIIVAEQIPSKILPDVVKNSALKVMHRLPAKDDRDVVGATMNLQPEQSEYVVGVRPGIAAVATDGMDRPVLVRMPGDPDRRETAASARFDPPLAGRRSPRCGAACLARPCTGREARAGELAADDPLVTIWIEAVVAAHVMGLDSPHPAPEWRDELRARDDRLVQCALAFAIDRSVSARRAALAVDVDPEQFADHVRAFATHHLWDGEQACDPSGDVRWQAGNHRWNDVHGALRRRIDHVATVDGGPHPDTETWRERGLHLDSLTCQGQLEQLERHPALALDASATAFGDTAASGLAMAWSTLTTHLSTREAAFPTLLRPVGGRDAAWLAT